VNVLVPNVAFAFRITCPVDPPMPSGKTIVAVAVPPVVIFPFNTIWPGEFPTLSCNWLLLAAVPPAQVIAVDLMIVRIFVAASRRETLPLPPLSPTVSAPTVALELSVIVAEAARGT